MRQLNWTERPRSRAFIEHLADSGLDRWLEPGPLTIVVGPNGGGKSTVIDLLRALADPVCWPGLPRENYPGDDFSGFDAEGPEWTLSARFSKYTPDATQTFDFMTAYIVGCRGQDVVSEQVLLPKYHAAGAWRDTVGQIVSRVPAIGVRYLSAVQQSPGMGIDDQALVALLNELSPHFPSVFANPQMAPFRLFEGAAAGEGRIGVFFKDDCGQHAFVHRDNLPLGWLQLASVLAFIRGCTPGSLILLDEPDRHLHPSLQRAMLELVAAESRKRGAQVVLATHSAVLTNPELCASAGAGVWVAARGRCEPLSDNRRVLDDLGVTSGDLVQANGIIWVEGPSDRLYLKTWLELRARALGQVPPVERVHYVFVSFGGALIKHLTLADALEERVAIRSINRNFAMVIDRDLPQSPGGIPEAEKRRLLAEADALACSDAVWITEGYTVEDYLPPEFIANRLNHDAAGRTRVIGSKVDLAARFRREASDWESGFAPGSDLPVRIDDLLHRIAAWQTPQEVITPAFIPPWLRLDDDSS